MNEIRKDYLLDRWVILAPRRSKRPKEIVEEKQEYKLNCPFCPNNEYMTPPTIFQFPNKNWKVRVIENKYPALSDSVKFDEVRKKLRTKMSGFGKHEVLIDSEKHNLHMGDFSLKRMKLWFDTIKKRVDSHRKVKGIKFTSVFKNHGAESGASLEHQHTQILSIPFKPHLIEAEVESAKEYYEFNGTCFFCDLAGMESRSKRVVIDNDYVTAFCAYAPLWPYEIWIVPKRHLTSFKMPEVVEREILKALKNILKAYYNILSDPPFNLFFHYVFDPESEESEYYHFHIEIAPRLEKDGGFEYASGVNITTMLPEDAAKDLRKELKRIQ